MKKLTAEKCRSVIDGFKWMAAEGPGMSIRDEYDIQAYEIALPILEQQERGEGEWIECSERMPESGTSVLVWDEEVLVGESAGCTTHYDLGIFWVHDKREGCCVKSYASHWQPLPAPPERATNQNGEQ